MATLPAALPVRPRTGRLLVLATVFVCAACGLVYELELLALGSYLIGDSVTQASVVLSVMVFAMGVGSLLAKRLRRRPAFGFAVIEAGLALLGGLSAMALYASFAWLGESRPALVAFSFAIGVLIGAEIPLLMVLIQRIRRQDAGGAVADLFAADYVGALVGGLAFPFLLLPVLGQLTGAMLTGTVNAVVGAGLVLWLFRRDLSRLLPLAAHRRERHRAGRARLRDRPRRRLRAGRPARRVRRRGPGRAADRRPGARADRPRHRLPARPRPVPRRPHCGSAATTSTATTRPSCTPR